MPPLKETILQFGAGNFLRAFVDVFVHEANQTGQKIGRIVVVQSTESNRAKLLNAQNGQYHVLTQGIENGQKIDQTLRVESISRALIAQKDWGKIIEFAHSPDLKYIISNVTEAGLVLDFSDEISQETRTSFPAKLLLILQARHQADLPGLILLPCELVARNGDILRDLVLEQAQMWHLSQDFQSWIRHENIWCNTLVDRIVSGLPETHPLLPQDRLLTAAEPFAQWVIESPLGSDALFSHPAIIQTDNVDPYSLRKVRVLNGAHTALVAHAMPYGIITVREALENDQINAYLKQLLFEEICPVIQSRVDQVERFAHQVIERFANPYLNHRLSDIALHHETKIQTRLLPTYREYIEQFGTKPALLHETLKGYL